MDNQRVIDGFLNLMVQLGGSDLHIRVGIAPSVRVNGQLRAVEYPPLSESQVTHLLKEIVDPKQWDNIRDLDMAYACSVGRFRVNIFSDLRGPGAVFRVIPMDIPTPEKIGMPQAVRDLAKEHKGLILVTGPTGSGKSTTMASLVNIINSTRADHILTLEDPIEFVHEPKSAVITQREIGRHTESFARALKAALREDPDVILVGELRDPETISLACTAAETGHLVIGTLHTSSAAQTINRILDSFAHEQQPQIRAQLSQTLRAVVAQQLVERVGNKGRVAAFEVMIVNNAIRTMLRDGKQQQITGIIATQRSIGMQTMDQALLDLLKKGFISQHAALAKAADPASVRREIEAAGYKLD